MPNTPTHGDYDVTEVENFDNLMSVLTDINQADTYQKTVELVADVLMNGHKGVSGYLVFGNTKLSKKIGIFNMNAATDCPNAKTREDGESETGFCQVPWNDCYAHKAEYIYKDTLDKRRLQEYLWDNIDAMTFADALLRVKERKRSAFEFVRVSEAGDFRHQGDISKWTNIARRLGDEITVYTYSASHKLDWSDREHFTLMASNARAPYGDKRYAYAIPREMLEDGQDADDVLLIEDVEDNDDWMLCPYDRTDGDVKCGDCKACMVPQGPNVYITPH